MANSFLLPLLDLPFYWWLIYCLPQIFVGDVIRPSDVNDAPQTLVDKDLEFVQEALCCSPGFCPVQKNGLHFGIKEA